MRPYLLLPVLALLSCDQGEPPELDVHSWAHGCYALNTSKGYLTTAGDGYDLSGETLAAATAFRFQPSGLGTYLLYDPDKGYVVAEGEGITRLTTLESDMTRVDDSYLSGAEWVLETSRRDHERYQLRSRRTGTLLGQDGLTTEDKKAVAVSFEATEGCSTYPELTLDAEGSITQTTWEDGDVYGFVDMHSHIFSNFGFGGALFHGSAFHPLGVEHALPDCDVVHGENGRKDLFGYAYDGGGNDGSVGELIPALLKGELEEDNHVTDGYPDFTEWPNARKRSTHQVQYYKWIERAYLSGLRLIVQHATTNSVICNISVGEGWVPSRYDCEDMTATDREIAAVYELEDYIDAQSGGPEQGWFRVVKTPAEAREVIASGKLAVILGIETSDLFNCHLTPRPNGPVCDEAYVDSQLDEYYEKGVRVLFPNHKYDNAFAPGDGSGGFIEAGNFLNSGYYTNKVQDCPTDIPNGFDHGPVEFKNLNEPRDVYQSEPDEDLSELPEAPVDTILPFAGKLLGGSIEGDHCQNGTLTPIGEHLLEGMMKRGMVIEVDHLSRRAYKRAYEMLEENNYPAVGTHGRDNYGKLYEVGGLSERGFGRCHDAANPGSSLKGRRERLDLMVEAGQYPALGLGFDLNGFAHGPGPRFGDEACNDSQENPVTYPFTSVDGDITFTQPVAGNRVFDFNTEGMIHVGLLPEYLEDARHDGATEEDMESLFRSAEGYIRMWERAESRAADLRGE